MCMYIYTPHFLRLGLHVALHGVDDIYVYRYMYIYMYYIYIYIYPRYSALACMLPCMVSMTFMHTYRYMYIYMHYTYTRDTRPWPACCPAWCR